MISSGVFYRWGFYAPDGPALDEVSKLVDAGKVLYWLITDIMHAGILVIQNYLCWQNGELESLSFANRSQPEVQMHAIVHAVWFPSLRPWIWTYQEFHTCLYLRLPCGFVKECALCVGWLVGNWVRRQENVNGFLNSAEQPFAKVCWTSVLLSWGLQLAVHSGSVAGSYRHPHTHTTHHHAQNTHIHTLPACPILSQKCGRFPVWHHCAPHSLLPTRDADQNNKPGCSCCGTSAGLSSLITFCTPPSLFSHCSYESRDDVVLAACGYLYV